MVETKTDFAIPQSVRRVRALWMAAAALAALFVIASLWRTTGAAVHASARRAQSFDPSTELVGVSGPRQIFVNRETPLMHNLEVISVSKQNVTYPLLTVTGSVVARIRPGDEAVELRWQFASAELASTYADLLKTTADIEFNKNRLTTIRDLTAAQISRYEGILTHLRPLGPEGVAGKDLRMAEADLVQAKLQGQKDVFEAETALRTATREKLALERQLAQAGIETVVLSRAREGMVLLSANVPESKISLVYLGQPCEVHFFGFPGAVFSADVEELGSVLSTERRTLRVLFDLSDDKGLLKPGMFAEIGLGTNAREALLLPTSAILHVGRADYVFRQASDGIHFDVVEVRVSESRGDQVEVLSGLEPGDRVAGNETVLLKPLLLQSLAR
jgi:multidrug efflux pump subunit AcrA (membrane-fusion protein)